MTIRKRTRREVYRLALHYAIAERDSYAAAWEKGSPERTRAEDLAAEFRQVLKEAFGEVTWEDEFAAANHPSISVHDIVGSDKP
jgi:hypothetical protein